MNSTDWYKKLKKPSWAPPEWLFGPAWGVLYLGIFITFGTVFYHAVSGDLSWIVAMPFILNLVFNFSYTPLQFGLKNNLLAAVDIIFILATLVWLVLAIYPFYPWISFANIPYLLWVMFATALQLTITYLNWGDNGKK